MQEDCSRHVNQQPEMPVLVANTNTSADFDDHSYNLLQSSDSSLMLSALIGLGQWLKQVKAGDSALYLS